jgi:cholest-4-en-3-one 26-monooxygenase
MQVTDVDLTDPEVFLEGRHHEMLATLRRDEPVYWQDYEHGGFWSLTRHADVQMANRDNELFSSASDGVNIRDLEDFVPGESGAAEQMMIMMDPPRHTRYRLLINKGFTPRMIGLLEQHLAEKARLIVETAASMDSGDFVRDVAAELPLQAIAELVGIPAQDRHLIFEWSNRMVGIDDPEFGEQEGTIEASAEMFAYSTELRELRRRNPGDDIVTSLLGAEVEGHRLDDNEFAMFFLLLTVAGNETTRNATAHGMRALIEHPDQFRQLHDVVAAGGAEADRLLESAVEEILRWSTPIHHFRRTATRDVEVGGRPIRAGDRVVMWYISANRDEAVFDDPFHFDITRSPNEQVSFGAGGPHFCLGANLARMELKLIFRELVTGLPDIELAGEPEMLRSNFVHGLKRMPVTFA